jgi:hypothetical protein
MNVLDSIKLSPSDLTFLWDECKRCFFLKYKRKISRPFGVMPGIFGTIDKLMKDFYSGKATSEISIDLKPGFIRFGERWVESEPLRLPGHSLTFSIRGKFDTIVAFDDDTFGIVDFKTSQPKPYHIAFYGRQLHAYAYALEHAAPGRFAVRPISILGLLFFSPDALEFTAKGQIAYLGKMTWMEIPRQDDQFNQFIDEVLTVLEQPDPPLAAEKCPYCSYLHNAREHGL